jgi:methyltransferase (TIGR00027 family)
VPDSLTFVGVDFATQSLADALPAAGLRGDVPTFYSWLGVVSYLERDRVFTTLRFLAGASPPGSEIVFDYARPPSSLGLGPRLVFEALARRVAAVGEPWITFFEPDELTVALLEAGFREAEDVPPARINALYFDARADSLRVGGIGHLMSARV